MREDVRISLRFAIAAFMAAAAVTTTYDLIFALDLAVCVFNVAIGAIGLIEHVLNAGAYDDR